MNTPAARTQLAPHHWQVSAQQSITYEVKAVSGVFDPANPALIEAGATVATERPRRFVVVDAEVHERYGQDIRAYLEHHGCEYRLCVLPAAEEAKTMDAVFTIVRGLDAFGISRRHEPIIGIGGGIVLDIVGLAAGLYRRSTPYVRVPTSLIGLVDAGIGVKTGVNFGCHKNRLGSYSPASVALLDRGFLATLADRHVSNGLAEILKIALIKDARLFRLLEEYAELLLAERLTGQTLTGEIIATEVFNRAVGGMLDELRPNLWEKELERVVDYGHSFSPTLEMRALPALLHGEAVAIDMALTTVLAERRGLVSERDRERIFTLMRRLRLPVWHPLLDADLLGQALRETTRHRDGLQRMPLPVGIGAACFRNDLTAAELADAADALAGLACPDRGGPQVRRDGLSSTWGAITWSSLPPGAVRDERPDTDRFYFVLAGDGRLDVDDAPHRLRPGHLVATRTGSAHRFANLGAEELLAGDRRAARGRCGVIPGASAVHHVAYTVPDLDAAVAFFTEVIGARLVYEEGPVRDDEGDWMTRKLAVHPTATARVAMLRLGPVTNLELFEYNAPDQRRQLPRNSDWGGHHLAIHVADVDAAADYLRSRGVDVLGDPETIADGPIAGDRWVYFLTPWGMQMELINLPAGAPFEQRTAARLYRPDRPWSTE
ncbi:iron-containing alcohol dehydrogenase [Actinokineospora sp. NPDC004072]